MSGIKILKKSAFIAAVAAIVIISAFIYVNVENKSGAEEYRPDDKYISQNFSFTLKDYNGNLAVYRGKSEQPYMILEELTSYLNEYDRIAVKKGITVDNEKAMRHLIEDMTS